MELAYGSVIGGKMFAQTKRDRGYLPARGPASPCQRRSAAAEAALAAASNAQMPPLAPLGEPTPVLGGVVGGQLPLGQLHFPSKQVNGGLQALPHSPQWSLLQQVATQAP